MIALALVGAHDEHAAAVGTFWFRGLLDRFSFNRLGLGWLHGHHLAIANQLHKPGAVN
jgi:hypothetical protein